uniref:EF-hand domain-containing protein n=1 Tax=Octactis speculum TaxID=3111310 RepID=A0A7S2CRS5_9STRA|mmetsp:Transcript_3927/g.4557  ORF Transcript_3927/g.4557 Transcript_3927/m.4557 type:complete len:149 (+) Transcript_3927:264-710(+)
MKSNERNTPLPERLMRRAREVFVQTFQCGDAARFQALIVRTTSSYSASELYQMGIIATATARNDEAAQNPIHCDDDVSLEGFEIFVRELEGNICSSSLNLAAMEHIFREIDTSGNLLLDEGEFKSALERLRRIEATQEKAKAAVNVTL